MVVYCSWMWKNFVGYLCVGLQNMFGNIVDAETVGMFFLDLAPLIEIMYFYLLNLNGGIL